MKFGQNLKHSFSKGKVTVGIFVVVIGSVMAYSYFSPKAPKANPSTVNGAALGTQTTQGGVSLDPDYQEKLQQADKQRVEEAKKNKTSVMPTIIAGNQGQDQPAPSLDLTPPKTPVVDNPEPEIMQQPIVVQQPLTETVPIVAAPVPVEAQVPQENVQAMVQAMNAARRPIVPAQVLTFGEAPVPVALAEQSAPSASGSSSAQDAASKVKLPLSGTILYAQLIGRANSENPGPVLARVLQGEYEGATLIGSFSTTRSALIIKFEKMTVGTTRSGEVVNETVPIETVAVDTRYIGTGLATSVDRHMFEKLAIGFVSGFAKGFGDAIQETGETTISTSNGTITTGGNDLNTKEELLSASGEAVSNAGQVLQQEFGNRPTTIIVESGTPIGVLFL
jgi:intracellular multiplication protein IcmE